MEEENELNQFPAIFGSLIFNGTGDGQSLQGRRGNQSAFRNVGQRSEVAVQLSDRHFAADNRAVLEQNVRLSEPSRRPSSDMNVASPEMLTMRATTDQASLRHRAVPSPRMRNFRQQHGNVRSPAPALNAATHVGVGWRRFARLRREAHEAFGSPEIRVRRFPNSRAIRTPPSRLHSTRSERRWFPPIRTGGSTNLRSPVSSSPVTMRSRTIDVGPATPDSPTNSAFVNIPAPFVEPSNSVPSNEPVGNAGFQRSNLLPVSDATEVSTPRPPEPLPGLTTEIQGRITQRTPINPSPSANQQQILYPSQGGILVVPIEQDAFSRSLGIAWVRPENQIALGNQPAVLVDDLTQPIDSPTSHVEDLAQLEHSFIQ